MSNKDTAKEILTGVIADAVKRRESEPSQLETRINLSTSQLSVLGGDRTTTSNMESKDEKLVKELEEQKRILYQQMQEIENAGDNLTENQLHLRNLRMKRRLISQDLRATLEKINEEKYEEECKSKATAKSTKIREEINTVFTGYTDQIKLTEETQPHLPEILP